MQPRDKRGSPCEAEEEDEAEEEQATSKHHRLTNRPTDRPASQPPPTPHIRLTHSLRSSVDKQSEPLRTSLFSGSREEDWQKVSKSGQNWVSMVRKGLGTCQVIVG
ncbi:hypothetical protein Y032_0011g1323 [Ancylostoma ceylanicum]|uniref:Uncharacterized protein n=1 Tax=Ancylostoma ceylanicum TaxID=53326 RepID=A0A016VDE5_9BILA|nr:hypothetical protein Y032_0011g1323 [Ancylostoma ceylanicum]